MLQIQNLTVDPYQSQTLVLEDGTSFYIVLYFRPLQTGWFIEKLTYGDFVVNGIRITNSPNMLYQWQNKLPFGLGCFSTNNREPSQQNDFISGASKLYILTQAEVQEFTDYVQNG